MKATIFIIFLILQLNNLILGQFAPAANQVGSTAIYKDSSIIINWASQVVELIRGPENISNSNSMLASFGEGSNALFSAEGNSTEVVSLGDGGSITLAFPYPISNAAGPDFAVFENSFDHQYLEFAFVEVSSNGVDFVRFPATSNISTSNQTGSFGYSDPTKVNNLAGKYQQGFGTPFDLADLIDSTHLNLDSILYVKIIDVVGSIDPAYGSMDKNGQLINDPFPTEFNSGGFDLDAVAVIHQNNPLSLLDVEVMKFKLFPNPSKNVVYISHNLGHGNYRILDLSGKIVLGGELTLQTEVIDLSMLSNGHYYIRINNDEQAATQKLIVIK